MDVLDAADGVAVAQGGFSEAVYAGLKKSSVRFIVTRSAGYENYDLEKLRSSGIRFCNVPSYSPTSIAEFAFATALAINRRIPQFARRAREGDFR